MSRGESGAYGGRGRIGKRTPSQLALLVAFALATLVWMPRPAFLEQRASDEK